MLECRRCRLQKTSMYSKSAALASRRVRNFVRCTISVFSELKKLSMGALSRQFHFRLIRCPAVHVYMHERGSRDVIESEQFPLTVAGILHAPVGVDDQPRYGASVADRHFQRIFAQGAFEPLVLLIGAAPGVKGSHCPPRHSWWAVAAVGSQTACSRWTVSEFDQPPSSPGA